MTESRAPNIQPNDILEVFVIKPDPAFVPAEIADEIGITKEGARYQMEKLVDKGYLDKKKPSSRVVFYWITPAGHEYYSSGGNGEAS